MSDKLRSNFQPRYDENHVGVFSCFGSMKPPVWSAAARTHGLADSRTIRLETCKAVSLGFCGSQKSCHTWPCPEGKHSLMDCNSSC
ncbi:hypothetical protein, partial [Alcaligenes phenolicus]|uniref:hypothetical protein n=1 Tax=Alcaligenes phenolicus TaxID=232846 RepID=UPI002AA694DE